MAADKMYFKEGNTGDYDVPVGLYDSQLVRITEKDMDGEYGPYVRIYLTFEIIEEGNEKGKMAVASDTCHRSEDGQLVISTNSKKPLYRWLGVLGFQKLSGEFLSLKDLIGSYATVDVERNKYTDKNGKPAENSRIKDIHPMKNKPAKPMSPVDSDPTIISSGPKQGTATLNTNVSGKTQIVTNPVVSNTVEELEF